MTYEEFKQSFLPEFLNINSYAGRIRFANENLERIASGSGRIVYNIDGEKVLKLAKNPKGVAQNEAEEGASDYYSKRIVTEVFDHAEDHTWLVAELAKKVTKKRIEELTGIPSFKDLFYFLRNFKEQNNGREKMFGQEKELEEFFWNNEFSSNLADFVGSYNESARDMGKPSSYGEVLRDGQPTIVLIDYGLNDEVFDTHYDSDREKKYQMYELFNYADGNDDILSDAGGGQDIRRGMWAQMPYSVDDGQGVINEKFIKFVKNRNKYPNKAVDGIGMLADGFHECVNNIKGILEIVDNKEQFYNNLLELQNYLTEQGYYNRDPLLKEEYVINEEVPDVEPSSLDDKNYSDELAKDVAVKLNLNQPRYLGGGGYGFAYEINDNLVLKITSDISEADAASKLMRGNPEHVAKIFNLYKVHDTENDKAYFAILQENITDKPKEKFRKIEEDINKIRPDGLTYVDFVTSREMRIPKKFNYDYAINYANQLLTANPEANVSEEDRKAAYQFIMSIIDIRKELLNLGIKSTDYTVIDNLGFKNGELKFFDVGGYGGVKEPNFQDNNIITLPEDGSAKFSSDTAINQDEFPPYNTNDTTPSINNNLDANSANYSMYEDLEYNHVKGDATDDEYMLSEINYGNVKQFPFKRGRVYDERKGDDWGGGEFNVDYKFNTPENEYTVTVMYYEYEHNQWSILPVYDTDNAQGNELTNEHVQFNVLSTIIGIVKNELNISSLPIKRIEIVINQEDTDIRRSGIYLDMMKNMFPNSKIVKGSDGLSFDVYLNEEHSESLGAVNEVDNESKYISMYEDLIYKHIMEMIENHE